MAAPPGAPGWTIGARAPAGRVTRRAGNSGKKDQESTGWNAGLKG
jgi:hypothetical protein